MCTNHNHAGPPPAWLEYGMFVAIVAGILYVVGAYIFGWPMGVAGGK